MRLPSPTLVASAKGRAIEPARDPTNAMLAVRELHKSYGPIRALAGVSFQLDAGSVVGLLGPNGAGKSTTIKIITGSIPPDRGSVEIAGTKLDQTTSSARRRIGYLPESAPLYPEMRVIDLLRFRCRLFGVPAKSAKRAIASAMDRCWLTDVSRRRIGQLSKGYRQRVGLAAALVHDPDIIMLDEPSNGLDPSQIRSMRELIRELGESKLVLLSSHILAEVELTCDRVIVLARGTVRADGTPAELASRASAAGRYRVECAGDSVAAAVERIEAIDNIASVVRTDADGWSTLTITAKDPKDDLRSAIGDACREAGVRVRELSRESARLERAFVEALTAEPETMATQTSDEEAAA